MCKNSPHLLTRLLELVYSSKRSSGEVSVVNQFYQQEMKRVKKNGSGLSAAYNESGFCSYRCF